MNQRPICKEYSVEVDRVKTKLACINELLVGGSMLEDRGCFRCNGFDPVKGRTRSIDIGESSDVFVRIDYWLEDIAT